MLPGERFYLEFDDPLFRKVWAKGEMWERKGNTKFLKKIERFSRVDVDAFGPIYYCMKCERLEDGCHRSWVRRAKGLKGVDVVAGRTCWKNIEGLIGTIVDCGLSRKDHAWVRACEAKKWNHLKEIDFQGKTYLDVGSQVGFSCFMAWNYGASSVDGVEIRKEVYNVAQKVKGVLEANEITFHRGDWLEVKSHFGQYDIVSCMGLMHYFPVGVYGPVLDDLCAKAKEKLILDLRTWDKEAVAYHIVGTQTLIGRDYLENSLNDNGFQVVKKIDNSFLGMAAAGGRELWIMERK